MSTFLPCLISPMGPNKTVSAPRLVCAWPSLPFVPHNFTRVSSTSKYCSRVFSWPAFPVIPTCLAGVLVPTALEPPWNRLGTGLGHYHLPDFQTLCQHQIDRIILLCSLGAQVLGEFKIDVRALLLRALLDRPRRAGRQISRFGVATATATAGCASWASTAQLHSHERIRTVVMAGISLLAVLSASLVTSRIAGQNFCEPMPGALCPVVPD
jgi:hypothetical protein